ncbi:DUF6417 family protein [Streptomyces sp. NPDC057621]|uniref:DUF6417 family protein n=1 Tax=Streptomyces sp. NPDC057621 TaxID=3346186 RepID=UPI003693FE1C
MRDGAQQAGVDPVMDDDDDFLGADATALVASVEREAERLPVLSLAETHDVLRLLLAVAREGGAHAPEAERFAKEIAARVPAPD